MSLSAAQQALFFKEARIQESVWTIKDARGFPAPLVGGKTQRVMPFWSTQSRAQKVIDTVEAYHGFTPFEIPIDKWIEDWLAGLELDNTLVGLNWYGQHATGYGLTPNTVRNRLKAAS
ncbi:DUF2750 domain-containing protein [Candidatus Saccharibacteria bacterium]|nr:MAG: DUF2750 domain-containing protein [Candidatus Saccharibacteria bacterium]